MKEYDVVKLKKDIPEKKLKKGMKGAIVMVFSEPYLPLSYEVEFVDDVGETIAIETIRNEDLELSLKGEKLHPSQPNGCDNR